MVHHNIPLWYGKSWPTLIFFPKIRCVHFRSFAFSFKHWINYSVHFRALILFCIDLNVAFRDSHSLIDQIEMAKCYFRLCTSWLGFLRFSFKSTSTVGLRHILSQTEKSTHCLGTVATKRNVFDYATALATNRVKRIESEHFRQTDGLCRLSRYQLADEAKEIDRHNWIERFPWPFHDAPKRNWLNAMRCHRKLTGACLPVVHRFARMHTRKCIPIVNWEFIVFTFCICRLY